MNTSSTSWHLPPSYNKVVPPQNWLLVFKCWKMCWIGLTVNFRKSCKILINLFCILHLWITLFDGSRYTIVTLDQAARHVCRNIREIFRCIHMRHCHRRETEKVLYAWVIGHTSDLSFKDVRCWILNLCGFGMQKPTWNYLIISPHVKVAPKPLISEIKRTTLLETPSWRANQLTRKWRQSKLLYC